MSNNNDVKPLFVIFIHGFRGHGEGTFADFPNGVRAVLTNSGLKRDVEALVYPRYATRGHFTESVKNFCLWLDETLTAYKLATTEPEVVLCGHSMGGLLAADSITLYKSQELKPFTMPRFIALLAYDSPFFGLHQTLLHSTVERHATTVGETVGAAAAVASLLPITSMLNTNNAASQGEQSRNVKQATPVNEAGGWSWKTGLALAATATLAAGGAWLAKEKIKEGAEWVYDHFQFASELFDEEECQRRMERIEKGGYLFHCFYTIVVIPPMEKRTFIRLPPQDRTNRFSPVPSAAKDEIAAHTSMFVPSLDASYYQLRQDTILLIKKALTLE